MTYIIHPAGKWRALVIGTLTGFLGVGLIDLLTGILFGIEMNSTGFTFIGIMTIYYFLIGLPIAYILCFIFGIPLYLIFQKTGPMTKSKAVLLGTVLGTFLGGINFLLFIHNTTNNFLFLDFLSTIAVGAFAGYVAFQRTKENVAPQDAFA